MSKPHRGTPLKEAVRNIAIDAPPLSDESRPSSSSGGYNDPKGMPAEPRAARAAATLHRMIYDRELIASAADEDGYRKMIDPERLDPGTSAFRTDYKNIYLENERRWLQKVEVFEVGRVPSNVTH
jgi:hypothetical protein